MVKGEWRQLFGTKLDKPKLFRKNLHPSASFTSCPLILRDKIFYQFNLLFFVTCHREWQNLEIGDLKCLNLCKIVIDIGLFLH